MKDHVYVQLILTKMVLMIFEYIDDGDGFRDWLDIISLFKRSMRRKDPTKSGRFNLGEKQAIIVSSRVFIFSILSPFHSACRGKGLAHRCKVLPPSEKVKCCAPT